METIEDSLTFCIDSILCDYNNICIVEELNRVRICIIDIFHKTSPASRIKVSSSLIDEIILKINVSDIENVIEGVHDLGEKIIYMLSFEKLVRDNDGKWITKDKNLSN